MCRQLSTRGNRKENGDFIVNVSDLDIFGLDLDFVTGDSPEADILFVDIIYEFSKTNKLGDVLIVETKPPTHYHVIFGRRVNELEEKEQIMQRAINHPIIGYWMDFGWYEQFMRTGIMSFRVSKKMGRKPEIKKHIHVDGCDDMINEYLSNVYEVDKVENGLKILHL